MAALQLTITTVRGLICRMASSVAVSQPLRGGSTTITSGRAPSAASRAAAAPASWQRNSARPFGSPSRAAVACAPSTAWGTKYDPNYRTFRKELAGGALLDAGVYPIEFAMGVLGEHPVETAGVQLPAETGVDAMDLFSMRFPSGAMAELSCSISLALPTDAVILGARGSIVVRDFLRSTRCELYDSHGDCVATFTEDVEDGFVYEIEHFCALFESGAKESPLVPLADTIACAEVFDALLRR